MPDTMAYGVMEYNSTHSKHRHLAHCKVKVSLCLVEHHGPGSGGAVKHRALLNSAMNEQFCTLRTLPWRNLRRYLLESLLDGPPNLDAVRKRNIFLVP